MKDVIIQEYQNWERSWVPNKSKLKNKSQVVPL
jgi:hypothetical protein